MASYGLHIVLTYAGAVQYVAKFGQPRIRTKTIRALSESHGGRWGDYIGAWSVPVLSSTRPPQAPSWQRWPKTSNAALRFSIKPAGTSEPC